MLVDHSLVGKVLGREAVDWQQVTLPDTRV
jgi:hypothetical protein